MEENAESARPVVLIVDDEVGILNAMRRTLRREGYEILTAEGPRQALELIDAHQVDLVLCDQMMPEMRGVALLEEIGRRTPKAARVLITGWIDDVGADALAERGITGPLAKPWEDAVLKETLRKALAQIQRR